MRFLQIFSLDLFILKIIYRAESRECYSFVAGMLFSLVERSEPHCMFACRYFACLQNSSRRSARLRTLPCKILITSHKIPYFLFYFFRICCLILFTICKITYFEWYIFLFTSSQNFHRRSKSIGYRWYTFFTKNMLMKVECLWCIITMSYRVLCNHCNDGGDDRARSSNSHRHSN